MFSSTQLLLRFTFLALLPLCLAGCSGASGNSISGNATMDGKPLDGAFLEFTPLERTEHIGGDVVQTDVQGNFTITPDRRKSGLKPGKYGVRVTKWVDKKTRQTPANTEDIEQLKQGGALINIVPRVYSDPEANPPITVDVKSGSNTGVKIDVKSK